MAFLIPDNLKSRKAMFRKGLPGRASPADGTLGRRDALVRAPLRSLETEAALRAADAGPGHLVLELLELKTSGGFLGVLRSKIRVLRDGVEVEVENPLDRARRFASVLQQRIGAEPRLKGAIAPVAAGAIFHVLSKSEAEVKGLSAIVSLQHCLFKEDIEAGLSGSGEAALQRTFVRMLNVEYRTPVRPEIEQLLRGVIQPETVIDRVDSKESKPA